MTKQTTPPTDGSNDTTRNKPLLRRRTLRVLTGPDLELVHGGAVRTGDENGVSRQPQCGR